LGGNQWEEIKVGIDIMPDKSSSNRFKCRCGDLVKMVKRDVNYNIKNDVGEVISPESAEHLAKYKIKCKQCKDDLCAK
jgi:hypothetical protein